MDYSAPKPTRYLLLPNEYDNGTCEMIDVISIKSINRDYYEWEDENGEPHAELNENSSIITIKRRDIETLKIPLSIKDLLSLINSDAEYHINGKEN